MDIPPSSNVDQIRQAIALVLLNNNVDLLFINIIGGGIMRCDAVSDALLTLNEQQPINVPIVARLAGTNSSLAIERLNASLPNCFVTTDLSSATAAAIDASNGIAANAKKKKSKPGKPSKAKPWWRRTKKKAESGVH